MNKETKEETIEEAKKIFKEEWVEAIVKRLALKTIVETIEKRR